MLKVKLCIVSNFDNMQKCSLVNTSNGRNFIASLNTKRQKLQNGGGKFTSNWSEKKKYPFDL